MSAPETLTPADRSQRQYNFSAGPATLPEEVLVEAKDELPVYDHVGASVMEISHRSPAYDKIEESAREHLRERALARAVRPHDRVHLARVHLEVDAAQDFAVFHAGVQVLDLQHWSFGHETIAPRTCD